MFEDAAKFRPLGLLGYLFNHGPLRTDLADARNSLDREVDGYDPDQLLSTPIEELAESLVIQFTVELPVLHRNGISTLPSEVSGGIVRRAFAIPFTGTPEVLRRQPKTVGATPPTGYVDQKTSELVLVLYDPAGPRPHPQQINNALHAALDTVDMFLEWARPEVESHNRYLATVAQRLTMRRDKILQDRAIEDAIGYPVRRREDADRYRVPVHRKTIRTTTPRGPTAPFTPEPKLDDDAYEAALSVLMTSRNALERSPSMTASLTEEKIRDLLLVNLNAHFEGAAAGEVFNGFGKTDILIRVNDRNIFIAECKIWHSLKTISDALDQLLGYLVWRDTKAALLLFIRTGNATEVIGKSISEIKSHPNCKRSLRPGQDGERNDFVFHAKGDRARDIHLAFLPFVLPSSAHHQSRPRVART